MKKILLPVLMLISSFAIAQDISISNVSPIGGVALKNNVNLSLVITIKAETVIATGGRVTIDYSWNDEEFTTAPGSITLADGIPEGTNININGISIKTPDIIGDTAKLKLRANFESDVKPANNVAIRLYYINDVLPYDLKVELTGPEKYSTIKTWSTETIEATITNLGTEDLKNNDPLLFGIIVNNSLQGNLTVRNYDGPTIKTNESAKVYVDVNFPKNFATGTLTFCLYYSMAKVEGGVASTIETFTEDNIGCTDLIFVINSVNDDFLELSSMNYNNGKLNLNIFNKETVSDYNFVVTSVTGQQIANVQHYIPTNSYSNESIALDGAASGVYILNIFADGQIVGTEKFIVR